MTKITELTAPRVIVQTLYPFSKYRVGQILELHTMPNRTTKAYYDRSDTYYPMDEEWVNRCTVIFKPLQWWEHRKESEMPEYLKDAEIENLFYKVVGYFQNGAMFENESGVECHSEHFVPATETGYLNYKNRTNEK